MENVIANSTTPEAWTRIEEFMRTHVGRYVLPKKLETAQAAGRPNVSVPVPDMVRLLNRVGDPVSAPEVASAPALPEALSTLPAELTSILDWEPDGEAILSREQVEALILRAIRVAYDTPRKRVSAPKVTTVSAQVGAAVSAGKSTVSVPTGALAGMLAQVEAQRNTVAAVAA